MTLTKKLNPGDTVIVTTSGGLVDLRDEIGEVVAYEGDWCWVQFDSAHAKKCGNGSGKWWMNPAGLKLLEKKK